VIHIAAFALAGIMFIKSPQFAVDQGLGGIEVNLVAAPTEFVPQPLKEMPVEPKSGMVEKPVVKVVKKIERPIPSKTLGKNKASLQSTGGAISKAKPDYLRNPAPEYPEMARRRGYEGTVLLKVTLDKKGIPLSVEIDKSSGHSILDLAALKAVKTWKFQPGKIGHVPVEATVRVPVKFHLDN
jgi:periplasmic protein TonB